MSARRWSLQTALLHYITDTLTYILTVETFYLGIFKWINCRKKEHETMIRIKKTAEKLDTTFTKSKGAFKTIGKRIKKKFQNDPESTLAELEKELTEVLKGTVEGLEKLNIFLDAMEKLAVTSLHVFTENQIVYLPEEICYEDVQAVIRTAQQVCPLLLKFKRDAKSFFLPSLHNLEVLADQLEKYIDAIEEIRKIHWKNCYKIEMTWEIIEEIVVDCYYMRVNSIQEMTYDIKHLHKIRMDEHFRMEFLFQKVSSAGFIDIFAASKNKMLRFLNDLEQCADELDRMNKGAKISNLAGSSIKTTGGALCAAGLALTPVTAGASLGLTFFGSVMAAAGEANSVVTTLTKAGVNHSSQKKANKTFQSFMEVFQKIQDYLDDGMKHSTVNLKPSKTEGLMKVGESVAKLDPAGMCVSAFINGASTLKKRVAGKRKDSSIQEMSGDGIASRSMSSGVLINPRHILSAVKESMTVPKGSKTKYSKFLTDRVALFRSQIESWDKIYNSLRESEPTKEENRNILKEPFYLEDRYYVAQRLGRSSYNWRIPHTDCLCRRCVTSPAGAWQPRLYQSAPGSWGYYTVRA